MLIGACVLIRTNMVVLIHQDIKVTIWVYDSFYTSHSVCTYALIISKRPGCALIGACMLNRMNQYFQVYWMVNEIMVLFFSFTAVRELGYNVPCLDVLGRRTCCLAYIPNRPREVE